MERKISFSSYDGTSLTGIYQSPDGVPCQALLMMHGLPSNKDEWGFYQDMAAFFESQDIATFRFDFRFNGESETGSLTNLTIAAMINDIESAFWQLQDCLKSNVPISVVGTSAGGGVTAAWCHAYMRKVNRIFLMAPVLDYEYEVTGKLKQLKENDFTQLQPGILELLKTKGGLNSDINYGYPFINEAHLFNIREQFKNIDSLVTIFHGDKDSIVPLAITKDCIAGFSRIELIVVKDADHGFAVEGDDNLIAPGTKINHQFVYREILNRITNGK